MDAPHNRGQAVIDLSAVSLVPAAASSLAIAGIGAAARHRWISNSRQFDSRGFESQDEEVHTTVPTDTHDLPVPRGEALRHLLARRGARLSGILLLLIAGVAIFGPVPTVIVVLSGVAAHRGRPLLSARGRRRAIERELPATIELLVLSIHAGLTPNQAIRELAASASRPVRPAFVEIVHRMDRGEPFASAIITLPETLGPRSVGLAEVIASADRYGLPLGQVLDQLSSEARSTRRRLDEAAARKLPIRLSFPLVVCTLPSFVLLAIAPTVIAALSSLGASVP